MPAFPAPPCGPNVGGKDYNGKHFSELRQLARAVFFGLWLWSLLISVFFGGSGLRSPGHPVFEAGDFACCGVSRGGEVAAGEYI